MDSLASLITAFALLEAAVEVFKMLREGELKLEHYAVFVLALPLLWFTKLNILTTFGLGEDGLGFTIMGTLLGAILSVRGSDVIHQLYKKVGM